MSTTGIRFDLVLVFFIYGLAFFSMGIALALESGRTPVLVERRAIRPLALFGLLHGMHEWVEIILLQGIWLGVPFPPQLASVRVGMLAISFIPLVYFGALMLQRTEQRYRYTGLSITLGLLLLYLLLVLYAARLDPDSFLPRADALARYLLAIPGGILAGLGLRARARQFRAEKRPNLATPFEWAALGFAVYGLTQVFVPPVDMALARSINSAFFLATFGFPVQVARAAMAVLITLNLLRAIQAVEREREEKLLAAQQARLEALELVQRDLVEREALRRELLRRTVIAQEDERARIARELHDETAQFLTALSLNLATLRNSVPLNLKIEEIVAQLQNQTRQMSQGIYRMVHDLRPAQLDDLGLVAALQYLAEEEQQRTGLKVTLEIDGACQRLDQLVETVIFRVAQEALTNVARHARCDQARLQLRFRPGEVNLRVQDEGIGLKPSADPSFLSSLGLAGMRERAESIGGKFSLVSQPGHGTLVEVTVPISEPGLKYAEEEPYESDPFDVGG
ncbi:MAG TPA: sensor histidine kinase [Anaerolineales bacterium]|nr:sensor histidine kinase [Anaerolineales bacterium]